MKVDKVNSLPQKQKANGKEQLKKTEPKNEKVKNKVVSTEKEAKTEVENVNKEKVKDGIEKLNETIQTFHEELKFELHEESERMMTKVVNIEEHEVIKEIPPKEILDMIGRIKKMVGLILDEKI